MKPVIDNPDLLVAIKKEGHLVGPKDMSLSKLSRITGPEKNMLWPEAKKAFDQRVNRFIKLIKDGWTSPPLIISHRPSGPYNIVDGNHRFEALKKLGYKNYSCFLWLKPKQNSNLQG